MTASHLARRPGRALAAALLTLGLGATTALAPSTAYAATAQTAAPTQDTRVTFDKADYAFAEGSGGSVTINVTSGSGQGETPVVVGDAVLSVLDRDGKEVGSSYRGITRQGTASFDLTEFLRLTGRPGETYTLSARFRGAGDYRPSTGTVPLTVVADPSAPIATRTTVSLARSDYQYGEPLEVVATVVEARTGKPATGRAELQSFTGRTWTQPLEEGRTTFRMPGYLGVDPDPQVLPLTKVRFLPAADTVQASGGESQGLSVTVRRATTTTSVTLSRSNPTADRPATATVRVEAPASASSPEGDVQVAVVKDDRYSFLGTAELHATARGVSEGSFVLDDPVFRTAGTAVLSTHYVGTSNHVGGLGTDQTLTVRPERATASVSTKLSVSSRRTGKATVTISAGRVVPTGKVTVRDGSRTLRTATLTTRSRGRATLTLPKLSRRTHTISVTYAGNDDVKPVTRSYRLKVR